MVDKNISDSAEPPKKKQKLDAAETRKPTHEAADTMSSEPRNTIYVNNLNDKIKINTLRENLYLLFATYGEVIKISMKPKQRGQAFVMLRTAEEANLALMSLKDELFFDKPLHLQFSKQDTVDV